MENVVFAVDCDEVLRSTLDSMIAVFNKYFPSYKKTREDIDDFVVDKSFPEIERETGIDAGKWFFDIHEKEVFDGAPMRMSLAAMLMLQNVGKVIVVTHQKSFSNKHNALSWLEKYGFTPDGICFVKDKTLIHADYLIDDNDWNFIGCNCKYGILVDAPYNKNVNVKDLTEKSNCSIITRFHDLYDFADWYVKNLEN